MALLLGAMVGLVLFRALPFLGPVPEGGLYNSDSAIPVLMSNLATGAPVDWLFWGQDRFGSWPFLLARAAGALTHRAWTPHGMHVLRTLWMVAALVPWLALAGRARAVAAAGFLVLPGLNPLLARVLVDLGTVDGWQVPTLLWAWWGLRRAVESPRGRRWLGLAVLAGALATWTSLRERAPAGRPRAGGGRRGRAGPAAAGGAVPPRAGRGGRRVDGPYLLAPGGARPRLARRPDPGVARRGTPPGERGTGRPDGVAGGRRPLARRRPRGRGGRAVGPPLAGHSRGTHRGRRGRRGAHRAPGGRGRPARAGQRLQPALPLPGALAGGARDLGAGGPGGCTRPRPGFALPGRRPSRALVGLGAVLLLAPVARPDPREEVLRPAAEAIAARWPGAVLTLSYWRTYALAGLLPPGAVVPVPREGEWNRRPDWAAALRSGRPVLVGTPDPGQARRRAGRARRGAAPGPAGGAHLPPFPGESSGERLSLYRLAAEDC